MTGLFFKKDLSGLLTDAQADGGPKLKRSLGALNLTMLGIGATIGAGIFTLTGEAAAHYAGPGIVFSFLLGGALCALAGLCYSEMAAMIPVAGSAYTYSYATMGEFVAWIIGWDLVLEYAFGGVAVANGWSSYLISLLHKSLGVSLPEGLLRFTKGPWEAVSLPGGGQVAGYWNLPATLLVLVVTAVLYRGIRESATLNNLTVILKVAIVILFVAVGLGVVEGANLHANPASAGLGGLVPAREAFLEGGRELHRFGWLRGGVLSGAGVVFFAYIGFDAVSTTAQEARNPKRDMPIGILASLAICTVLYILVALTLTGVVSFRELGVSDPIAVGVDRIVALRQWSPLAQRVFGSAVKLGALAGLTSVVLVILMAQIRVFFAMAKDGLIPWFDRVHPRYQTPQSATWVTGLCVSLCAGLMPISLVGKLVSIGTLLAFLLVCLGVPILRRTHPHAERPFRVPLPWVVGLSGAGACLWVMSGLDGGTWLRLLVWLMAGLGIYFLYGRRHSSLQRGRGMVYGPVARDIGGYALFLVGLGSSAWFLVRLGGGTGTGLATAGYPLAAETGGYLVGALLCLTVAGFGFHRVLFNTSSQGKG